jgi:hypothetical protein
VKILDHLFSPVPGSHCRSISERNCAGLTQQKIPAL